MNEPRHLFSLIAVTAVLGAVVGATLALAGLGMVVPATWGGLVALVILSASALFLVRATRGLGQRLRDDEARYRAVIETAVDGIITIDRRGIVRSFNRAAERIFGYSAKEVLGQNVKMLMPPPYREEHDEYISRYHRTGVRKIIGIGREVKARRKDGTVFPIDLAVSEAHSSLFTGIIRDITDRKELERTRESLIRELEQKNAELERFTYTVSHDLKSPLITISGFVGGLERDARAGNFTRLQQDVGRILAAVERMKNLLDELLELSRIGRIVNPPSDVSLLEVAKLVVEDLGGPLRERGVEVVLKDDLPIVRGDRVRLHEVIQNLMENAIKFMGNQSAPVIEVGVRQEGPRQVVYVRDNGLGIEPEYHHKIFGLFDQLDKDSPGTGIGLALVKRIVELHGGRIWVESQGVGHGSWFCFTFGEALPAANRTAHDADTTTTSSMQTHES